MGSWGDGGAVAGRRPRRRCRRRHLSWRALMGRYRRLYKRALERSSRLAARAIETGAFGLGERTRGCVGKVSGKRERDGSVVVCQSVV